MRLNPRRNLEWGARPLSQRLHFREFEIVLSDLEVLRTERFDLIPEFRGALLLVAAALGIVGAEVERTPGGMDAPRQGVGITGAAIPEDAEARGGAGV